MEERVAVFIDGSNLYHALRENFKRYDLNFAAFARKLVGERRLFRIYYYNILQDPTQRPEGAREQQEFLDTLRKTPYLEIRLGRMKLQQGIPIEKGVDIMLATDLLHYGWKGLFDTAVLVSGDADFAYALQTAKNMGIHVEVAYFESNISKDLLEVADNWHLLQGDFLKDLWASQRRGRRRRASTRKPVKVQSTAEGVARSEPTTIEP